MVALHILLGAEDQRNGLVDNILAQQQHILLLRAHRAFAALLEVNGASEGLLGAVL